MRQARRTSFALAVAGCTFAVLGVPQASAEVVQCGQVLTRSTRVSNDLECVGTALFAGRDGIVIDLAGHELARPAEDWSDVPAVDASGRERVRVQGGRIHRFFCGVRVGSDGTSVRRIRFSLTSYAVCGEGNRTRVEDNRLTSGFGSIQIQGRGGVVRGNELRGGYVEVYRPDGAPTEALVADNRIAGGIFVYGGVGTRVEGNRLLSHQFFGSGIRISQGDASTRVVGNSVTGGYSGIEVSQSVGRAQQAGVLVQGNRVTDVAGTGITVWGAFYDPDPYVGEAADRLIGNTVQGSGTGIALYSAARTLVRDNTVGERRPIAGGEAGNLTGILVGFYSHGVRLLGNRVFGNEEDGVAVQEETTGTQLRGNVASRNRGDGFDIDDPSTVMVRNTAFRNRGWGIDAVEGVSGSANSASRNLLGQCRPEELC